MNFTGLLESLNFFSTDPQIIILVAIMVMSGFLSGITGFGLAFFGAAGLFFFELKEIIIILLILSTMTQVISIWSLRDIMIPLRDWWREGPLPFMLGSIVGVPLGVFLLFTLNAQILCTIMGGIIFTYVVWSLSCPPKTFPALLSHKTRLLTGFIGGTVGGFSAAPGPVIVIWGTLTGIAKEKQRAIVQPYIVCAQVLTIIEQCFKPGGFSIESAKLALELSLVVVPANLIGVRIFRRMGAGSYRTAIMLLLGGMGLALAMKGFHIWGDLFLSLHRNHPLFNISGRAL